MNRKGHTTKSWVVTSKKGQWDKAMEVGSFVWTTVFYSCMCIHTHPHLKQKRKS